MRKESPRNSPVSRWSIAVDSSSTLPRCLQPQAALAVSHLRITVGVVRSIGGHGATAEALSRSYCKICARMVRYSDKHIFEIEIVVGVRVVVTGTVRSCQFGTWWFVCRAHRAQRCPSNAMLRLPSFLKTRLAPRKRSTNITSEESEHAELDGY